MDMRNDLAPKVRALASEVFNRSWQFIESDRYWLERPASGCRTGWRNSFSLLTVSFSSTASPIAARATKF